jgi:hypothetical protein
LILRLRETKIIWGSNKNNLGRYYGDTRIITKFLLFPKVFNNEWRWLEKTRIKQKFVATVTGGIWLDVDWAKEENNYNMIQIREGKTKGGMCCVLPKNPGPRPKNPPPKMCPNKNRGL